MKCSSLVVFCSWRGQASASQTRSTNAPRRCLLTDMSHGEKAIWCPCQWLFWTTSNLGLGPCVLQCASKLALPDGKQRRPELGHRLPTNGLLRQPSGDGRHTLALQHSTNVPSMSSTSTADAKRSNDARPSPVLHHTLRSLKATMLSIAKRIDVPEHHRAEQGHHCQHGGRASVRLYTGDDLWGVRLRASNLLFRK